jgi:hypothetical protein
MRNFLLLLLTISALSGYELTYISNDTTQQSLKGLQATYKQTLLVNDKRVYLIPSDCRLERYFGGASQADVILSKTPKQAQNVIITQAVFEAKDESTVKESIEAEKSIALVEGKVSKAFLDDNEGRGYGGASQLPLDFTFQKIAATQVHMKPEVQNKPKASNVKPYQHPSCQLLDNGSGYQLEHIKDAYLYFDQRLHPISDPTILFN